MTQVSKILRTVSCIFLLFKACIYKYDTLSEEREKFWRKFDHSTFELVSFPPAKTLELQQKKLK